MKITRLFGVDAPECSESSPDFVMGLEAKVFVEDLFKNSRFCYVREHEIDAYRRFLIEIFNEDQKNVSLELLKHGLAVPMMEYFESLAARAEYERATREAYEKECGLWSIPEIHTRFNNIISDDQVTKFNLLGYIPEKKSAIERYIQQSPKAKIIRAAFQRKTQSEDGKKTALEIFGVITDGLNPKERDIQKLKSMCDKYLYEIERFEQASNDADKVKDCIMHIEELLDELDLGEGEIKGNFSKGKNKLIYHSNPKDRWYQMCIPEIMFKTVQDAKMCGFKSRK
tara:strand:+ start:2265 stop:3116 length:852 start_codon:yes stop_codon:yes gene_type:complete